MVTEARKAYPVPLKQKMITGHENGLSHMTSSETAARGFDSDRLAAVLARYTGLPEARLLPFINIESAWDSLIGFYVNGDGHMLVAGPDSRHFIDSITRLGADLRQYQSENPFWADPVGLADDIDNETCLIYLGHPDPVTGTIYGLSELRHILDSAGQVMVVLDESEYEYSHITAQDLLEEYDNLLIFRTLSAFSRLPGNDGGYLLGNPGRLDELAPRLAVSANGTLSEPALPDGLKKLDFVRQQVADIKEGLIYLDTRLRGLGFDTRRTPFDRLLIRVPDPDRAVSFLSPHGLAGRNISTLAGLNGYITLGLESSSEVEKVLDTILLYMADQATLNDIAGNRTIFSGGGAYPDCGERELNKNRL